MHCPCCKSVSKINYLRESNEYACGSCGAEFSLKESEVKVYTAGNYKTFLSGILADLTEEFHSAARHRIGSTLT
jgi:transposase-like protein